MRVASFSHKRRPCISAATTSALVDGDKDDDNNDANHNSDGRPNQVSDRIKPSGLTRGRVVALHGDSFSEMTMYVFYITVS